MSKTPKPGEIVRGEDVQPWWVLRFVDNEEKGLTPGTMIVSMPGGPFGDTDGENGITLWLGPEHERDREKRAGWGNTEKEDTKFEFVCDLFEYFKRGMEDE